MNALIPEMKTEIASSKKKKSQYHSAQMLEVIRQVIGILKQQNFRGGISSELLQPLLTQ
jgi:hypothetical protein